MYKTKDDERAFVEEELSKLLELTFKLECELYSVISKSQRL
ncbi:MAG TPA: hypothetical protein VJH65_02285 [Candidatus Nanoarchaeia archaeon]|nr:hypothetical protein [Candidatus Nanoarchaeia archaeon]